MKNGQIDLQRWLQWWDLEDCEQGTGDGVKVGCGPSLRKIELTPKQLHPQQGEYEDEEKEEE